MTAQPEPEPPTRDAPPAINRYKLAVARMWASARQPYLASALFASPVVASPKVEGAAVDREWRLYLDPEKVESWTRDELGSILIHHASHLLRDHAGRAGRAGVSQSTREDWNTAADAEINDDLIGAGLRMPDNPILPQAKGWRSGQLAEEYYHQAGGMGTGADGDRRHNPVREPDCGSGSDGVLRPWELASNRAGLKGLGEADQHLLRCQVATTVLNYARQGRGRIPARWKRWAEDLMEPRVDWRRALAAQLRRHVAAVAGAADYTYRQRSRRADTVPDVILPAMARPVPEVAIVCDTSGSMTDADLARVLTEIESLLRTVGLARERVRVLAVDAAVRAVRRVSNVRQVELEGGGGTDMAAGVAAASRLRPRPTVLVVLTDGLTPWPASRPQGVEVVIALVGERGGIGRWQAPDWATVVRIPSGVR